ncbi:MAG TPA: PilZ domain-containing protein [Sphingomicrobium sp.]|nr:PilZ domain-containing protein [Sphingomicrobium sp.]
MMNQIATQPNGQPERRRADRAALRLAATMRTGGGKSRVQVRLIDISTHGCRIDCTSTVEADTWVWLSVTGLETQYCRVAWQCQEFIGLEFATPLAEPVLDRLLGSQQQLPETTIKELREISARTHWLATKGGDEDIHILAELSRKCAVDAVVEGFRLSQQSGKAGSDRKPKAR